MLSLERSYSDEIIAHAREDAPNECCGIIAGISSGAVLRTAQRAAERLDKGNVVLLLADGGWKYLSTSLWSKEYEELGDEIEGKVWW